MWTTIRSATNTGNSFLRLLALVFLGVASLGLSGCAGLVSGSSSKNVEGTSTPLTITNATATSATLSGFQVNWTTSAPATSQVDYGTTSAYGFTTGVASTMVSTHQAAITNLTPGTTYHFQIHSTDAKGNSASSADMTFSTLSDTIPPTVSITSPAAGATISGTAFIISATASDNVAVASVQFRVDGANTGLPVTAAPYTYTLNTTTLSNATHILTAVATDTSGNTATSAAVSVTVNNTTPDTTPPTVSLAAPVNGATVSNTVTVSANATDNVAVASVQFQLDNSNVGNAVLVAPYTYSWDTTKSANGTHTLRAIATDTSNNSATSASVTVTVNNTSKDTTPPTVSLTAPANGATVSGTVTISANATDNVAVARVQFQVDGANVGAAATTSPYSVSWNSATVSNGSHAVQAIATDTSNNSTTSAGVTITVTNPGAPPPPPGSTITSFQLTSPLSGISPFTVGLGFKDGDVPTGASLSIPNSQVVVERTWSDGSVKHAIASGFATLTANTALTVNVLNSPSASGTNLTASDIQAAAPSASIQCGSIGTVNLSSLLATPFRTWISGPQMVEAHYRSPVGSDPTLVAWFYVRLYKGGQMWVRAFVENGYLDVTTSDKNYVPTVIIGGTTVYNNGGASLTHYAQTRWTVDGWIGSDPQITPQHDTTYLEASKLVPNYMNLTPSSGALSSLTQTYTPMQEGDWTQSMGDTGFQNQIGILPLWDALYITSGADPRAYQSVLADANSINSYPIVWNDSATGLPTVPSNRPTWTVLGANGGGVTSWGAGSLSWDVAHHGSAGYMAYLITGDHFYLEDMENQAAMCYLVNTSSNGAGNSRQLGGQTRAVAWCLRTIGQLAGIGPISDPVVSGYQSFLAGNATIYNNLAQTPGMNPLGYIYSYELADGGYSSTAGVLSPWQEHFFVQSVATVSDLQPFSDMTTWNALRTHLDLIPVGILGPDGPNNFCFTDASVYTLQVSDSINPPTGWYTSWGIVWSANNAGALNTSCANTLQGASGGDPANASTGYWGNLMPAIAYAVDHGASGAAAAWTRLTGASNWATVQNSGFGDIPMWGIVPRSGSTTPPPPSGTSVSVTAPAAGATISGTNTVTASASSSVGIAGVQFQLDSANLGAQVIAAPYSI